MPKNKDAARRKAGRGTRALSWLALVPAFLLALTLGGCGETAQPSDAAPAAEASVSASPEAGEAVQVRTAKVVPVTMRDVLTLPGETAPDADVVLSSETEGTVLWVGPAEGDRVAVGQVLLRIDVSADQAKLQSAEVALRLAREQAERRKRLFAEQVLSREELDEALTAVDTARAAVDEARAGFVQGEVRSPIAGVVDSQDADPGEYVSKGQKLMEIVNRDVVRVQVSVPEMDVRYLAPGSGAEVTVDAWPGRDWSGRVSWIAAKADEGTRTFTTRVLVDNADGAIRPGMLARVRFVRREIEGAVAVPLSAIRDKGGERVLFVEDGGTARSRTVELGVIQGGLVQILKGLAPGENLIVAGQDAVEEGVRVRVQ